MEELARKAVSGDPAAERELFEQLLERFRYLAKRRVGEEDCEDLAQEACTTVFEKYRHEEFTVGFLAWAHGVLRMKIGNYLQKKRRTGEREAELDEDVDAPSHEVDATLKRHLLDCLRELIQAGGYYARILNLAHQGYQTAEICRRVGITANNYYVTLSRGRSMLRDCLQGKGVSA
jgi:RNA polymerase sigma factor (sigma-70 family)